MYNKSKIFMAMILLFVFVAVPAIRASEINFQSDRDNGKPVVKVLSCDDDKITLEVNVPRIWTEYYFRNGERFVRLSFPACGTTQEIGNPELPVIRKLLGVHEQAKLERIEILESDSEIIELEKRVYPFQKLLTEGQRKSPFILNQVCYEKAVFYPPSDETMCLSRAGKINCVPVRRFEFCPIQYDPQANILRVCAKLVVQFQFSHVPDRGLLTMQGRKTVWLDNYLAGLVQNYDYLKFDDEVSCTFVDDLKIRQLIICAHPFVGHESVKTLADWHTKRGIKTQVIDITDICEMPDPNALRDYLIAAYHDHVNYELEYVLLLGNPNIIPLISHWYQGDHYYACVDPAPPEDPDLYADFHISRLSVDEEVQLVNQISKLLVYMRNPGEGDWFNRCLMVAADKYQSNVNKIIYHDYSEPTPEFIALYGYEGATNDEVNEQIDLGVNIVTYRGHGLTHCWNGWTTDIESLYTTSNASELNNSITPVVMNIACSTGNIRYGGSLCDAFMDLEDMGTVSAFGATAPSYTKPNSYYIGKWFMKVWGDQSQLETVPGLMTSINVAKNMMIDAYGEYGEDNATMYLLLGDPTLYLWTEQPVNPEVSFPVYVSRNTKKINIEVSRQGEPLLPPPLVCLAGESSSGTVLYKRGFTDDSGQISFEVEIPPYCKAINLTVTGKNILPFERTILVHEHADQYYHVR